jgi:RimJ/RimL family protein N-acetyltransferase
VSALVLERLSESHLGAVEGLVVDPDVRRFTRVPDPPPAGFTQAWFGGYERGRRDGTREAFAVIEGDTFVGIAVAPKIDLPARTAELGYVVAPAARGRGVASEALRLLTDWAFAELELERLELMISIANEASKRVASRCGYRFEGVLRSLHFKGDLREDTEIWSRLRSDG